jgi:nitrite reductase (NADH) small subunit
MSIVLDPHAVRIGTPLDEEPNWHAVCALADLEPEWGEAALIDGQQIAVYRLWDDSVHAISNRDPATGSFVMARGIVGSRAGRATIASPLHKQVYDLTAGDCLSHPDLTVPVYPARVVDGVVEVGVSKAG